MFMSLGYFLGRKRPFFHPDSSQAEQQVKQADAELREKKSFEDLLPEVTQKCTLAEECMEKVGPGRVQDLDSLRIWKY